ncbi:hypothetical protein DCAR_0727214 [Daucus carota subsp. sativus]|uniref:Helicase C-terminal domain-containing protein n=1 Tax=Daucus carota subsp. sativus TaxID=79200 RepID=A0AAF0XH83_DAUCS|nr:hypothetical protein DCAR_0727214 [Daucus carota subsp. sativus]
MSLITSKIKGKVCKPRLGILLELHWVKPVIVNVGRSGAANLDVIQAVAFVKQEVKYVYLLECLQKTPPPVLVFSENKDEVDEIHEYLILKGVKGSISSFKAGTKDVLVATDVASKGLDFADIQHVIIFNMPAEIENYHVLIDAKQRLLPLLAEISTETTDVREACGNCGGHRIHDCPKLQHQNMQLAARFKTDTFVMGVTKRNSSSLIVEGTGVQCILRLSCNFTF